MIQRVRNQLCPLNPIAPTLPALESMSFRRRILTTVFHTMRKSSRNETWSTYQTSNSNLCVHEMAFRPLTCAHPVIPGRTSWRRACSGVYKSRYLMTSGLGPIIDISPLSTLNNCGSSSSEVFLRKAPTFVMRCSLGSRLPSSSFSSVIDLNLMMLKILPFNPGLCW